MVASHPTAVSFCGSVLSGGRSTRMGTDKALIEIDGVAMARRVMNALNDAGARDVVAIGGDAVALDALGLRVVPDAHPGAGPLGGILTALSSASEDIVVVSACDMPWLAAAHVAPLLAALVGNPELDMAISAADGERQPLHAAWRVSCRATLQTRFDAGERSPRRVAAHLRVALVELGPGRWSRDLDSPADR